jgi:nucleotide-binding universal stress UspA family protein
VIRSDNAVASIMSEARRERADLIVMGTRGRSGLRAVLGSVTERVLREARCPVLTIPPAAPGPGPDEWEPYSRILCTSNFSAACRKAFDLGLSMQGPDGRLVLLHVLQTPANDSGLMPLQPIIMDAIDRSEWRRDALARLEAALPDDVPRGRRPQAIVEPGHPAETILRVAEREQVGVIVMGVASRRAFDRLVFGSTTRRVIHGARCPVLSIRADAGDPAWIGAPARTHQPIDVGLLKGSFSGS